MKSVSMHKSEQMRISTGLVQRQKASLSILVVQSTVEGFHTIVLLHSRMHNYSGKGCLFSIKEFIKLDLPILESAEPQENVLSAARDYDKLFMPFRMSRMW